MTKRVRRYERRASAMSTYFWRHVWADPLIFYSDAFQPECQAQHLMQKR